jgi:undecaprenyl-diphosphatase
MHELNWLIAIVLGVVEGLTEFLPISSTGHLIIAGSLLGYTGEQAQALEIVIQGAAILAVCWEYRLRLIGTALTFTRDAQARGFLLNLVIAFLPAAVLGLLFKKVIEVYLFKPLPVAMALVVGGVLILLVDRREERAAMREVNDVKPLNALALGLWQALALFPGTSRAGATIIGGVLMGMSRKLATEYSFFLAIPILLAATAYKIVESGRLLAGANLGPVLLSAVIAFVTALFAVRGFIRYIGTHTFAAFAWYRIVFGLVILGTSAAGWVQW